MSISMIVISCFILKTFNASIGWWLALGIAIIIEVICSFGPEDGVKEGEEIKEVEEDA